MGGPSPIQSSPLQRLQSGERPDIARMVGPYSVGYSGLEYLIAPLCPSDEKTTSGDEQTPFLVRGVAALLCAAGLAREEFPIPPLRRELLLRLDLGLAGSDGQQPPPQAASETPDPSWRDKAWRGAARSFGRAANHILDGDHAARRRHYRFYRVIDATVLRLLQLRRPGGPPNV